MKIYKIEVEKSDPIKDEKLGWRSGKYVYLYIQRDPTHVRSNEKLLIMTLENKSWVYLAVKAILEAYSQESHVTESVWNKVVDIARPYLYYYVDFQTIKKFVKGESLEATKHEKTIQGRSKKVTRADIEAIRKRAEAASPGPWFWEEGERLYSDESDKIIGEVIVGEDEAFFDTSDPNFEFIEHSREDVSKLLQYIDDLTEDYIKLLFKTDLEKAKEEFKDYWYSWNNTHGHFEGVILEIEDGNYNVLCTDGIKRCVSRMKEGE